MDQTIYNYHPQTGEATSVAVADPSPLEPGIYLLPAYATPTPAPAAGVREVALFRAADGTVPADHAGGSWQLLPDWRGVALYSITDGVPVAIDVPGQSPADIGACEHPRPDPGHVWHKGAWLIDAAARSAWLQALRASRLVAINAGCDAALVALTISYPEREISSWPQQEREARVLAASPGVSVPLLAAIAAARGLDVAVLAARVREKSDAFAVASGAIIGRRQALEDAINAVDLNAVDAAARLEAITWLA